MIRRTCLLDVLQCWALSINDVFLSIIKKFYCWEVVLVHEEYFAMLFLENNQPLGKTSQHFSFIPYLSHIPSRVTLVLVELFGLYMCLSLFNSCAVFSWYNCFENDFISVSLHI